MLQYEIFWVSLPRIAPISPQNVPGWPIFNKKLLVYPNYSRIINYDYRQL